MLLSWEGIRLEIYHSHYGRAGLRDRPGRVGWADLEDVPAEGAPVSAGASGAGSRTLRNTAVVLTARVASRLLALVTVVVIERHLRPAGFGVLQTVVNYSALVTVLLDLGFNTLYQREAARSPEQISRYLSILVTARALFALVALPVLGAVLIVAGKSEHVLPGFAVMVLASYSSLLRGTLYAIGRLGFEAVEIVLETVVLLGLTLAGVATGRGVGWFLWAYAASYAFACAYYLLLFAVRRIARVRVRLEPRFVLSWLVRGLPFALAFVITTIYFKIDVPILNAFKGDVQTGWYTAAYKPFEALLFVPMTMLNVFFPVLSAQHRDPAGRVAWAVARFFKSLVLLGWPLAVGTFMLVGALLPLYQFPESALPLRILSLAIVVMFANNAFIAALNATDRQVMFTWAALGSMVVNIGLNLALIPAYGYLGASWATVATEVAFGVFGWLLTARCLGRVPVWRLTWRILLAGLVMGVALLPFQQVRGLTALPVIAGAATVYGLALLVLRAVDPDERQILRRALVRP